MIQFWRLCHQFVCFSENVLLPSIFECIWSNHHKMSFMPISVGNGHFESDAIIIHRGPFTAQIYLSFRLLCTIWGPIRHFITWTTVMEYFMSANLVRSMFSAQCNNEFHNGYKMNGKHFPIVYSLFCQPKLNFSFLCFLHSFQQSGMTFSPDGIFIYDPRTAQHIHKTIQKPQFPFRMKSKKSWNSIRVPIQLLSITKLWRCLTTILHFQLRNGFRNGICFSLLLSSINRINLNVLIECSHRTFSPPVLSKTWPEFKLFILYLNVFSLDSIRCYVHSIKEKPCRGWKK